MARMFEGNCPPSIHVTRGPGTCCTTGVTSGWMCINLTVSCAHCKVWEVAELIVKDEDVVWDMDKDVE